MPASHLQKTLAESSCSEPDNCFYLLFRHTPCLFLRHPLHGAQNNIFRTVHHKMELRALVHEIHPIPSLFFLLLLSDSWPKIHNFRQALIPSPLLQEIFHASPDKDRLHSYFFPLEYHKYPQASHKTETDKNNQYLAHR